ncbi:murein biosynthesis integral membrane protein MurJ [Priestia megaterium]|uniref:murein biosynthesis integral membrane protein MurJ n=1 Tax=Priestia megaterium TaxID=1404 RepID=UPI002EB1091C|nr:murein biosynthesis integral membrane protein MurJ [Priestia megaterium]
MHKNIKIASILVMGMTLIGKGISLIRDILITSNYGASYISDAYNVSYTLVIIIFGLINSALYNTLIPFLSEEYEKGKEQLFCFLNKVTTFLILIGITIIIVCLCFNNTLVNILAPDLSSRAHELAVKLVYLSVLSILFLILNSIYSATLRVYGHYFLPSIGSALFAIPSIFYLFFHHNPEIEGLVLTTVLGFALQTLVQIPFLIKKGYKYSLSFSLLDPKLKKMCILMPPILFSSGLVQINTIFDNMMASKFPEGSITILSVASKVNGIVFTVIGTSLLTVIYPILTKEFVSEDRSRYRNSIQQTINLVIAIMLPILLFIIVFREEVISMLFLRGDFDQKSVYLTAKVLLCYLAGLIFFVLRDLISFAFYAAKDTTTPLKISVISITINIVLNFILSNYLGLVGIALATSLAAMINYFLLLYKFKMKISSVNILSNKDIYISFIAVGTLLPVIIFLKQSLEPITILNIMIIGSVTVGIYLIILILAKHSLLNNTNNIMKIDKISFKIKAMLSKKNKVGK